MKEQIKSILLEEYPDARISNLRLYYNNKYGSRRMSVKINGTFLMLWMIEKTARAKIKNVLNDKKENTE